VVGCCEAELCTRLLRWFSKGPCVQFQKLQGTQMLISLENRHFQRMMRKPLGSITRCRHLSCSSSPQVHHSSAHVRSNRGADPVGEGLFLFFFGSLRKPNPQCKFGWTGLGSNAANAPGKASARRPERNRNSINLRHTCTDVDSRAASPYPEKIQLLMCHAHTHALLWRRLLFCFCLRVSRQLCTHSLHGNPKETKRICSCVFSTHSIEYAASYGRDGERSRAEITSDMRC